MTETLAELLGNENYQELQLKTVVNKADRGEFFPDLHPWLKKANPEFNWDWRYMRYMIGLLQDLSDGKIRKLMISLPPRSGKSELCSIHFPTYFLEKDPRNRVIMGTYNQTLANKFSRRVRSMCKDRVELDPDRKAMEEWNTKFGGGVRAVGVGAGIAGVGANLIVLDDIVRSRKDANSITVRNSTHSWYTDDIYTRLEPDSRILVLGCLRGSSRVLMSDGTVKEIKDISVGDSVLSWNNDTGQFESDTVKNWSFTKYEDTYSIETSAGTVYATKKHPFLTPDGFKKLEELEIGDYILSPKTIFTERKNVPQMFDGSEITPEFMWWLGFMFGDGWNTSWTRNNYDKVRDKYYKSRSWAICFAAGVDKNINQKVIDMFTLFFNRTPTYKSKERYYRVDFNSLGRYLDSIGFSSDYNAKTKRLPEWLWNVTVEEKREFLRGFLEADGWVNKRVPSESYGSEINNRLLMEDLKRLAQSCSIRTTKIHERTRLSKPPNSPKPIVATSFRCDFTFERATLNENCRLVQIKSISLGMFEPVYDIEVESNHNYIVEGMIVSNTRWHEDDIIGRIERSDDADEWVIVNLPAIAEDDDPLGRKPGEALNPERYPVEKLLDIKRVLGRSFNALYQGRPTEQEGEAFKASWFRNHVVDRIPLSITNKQRWEFVRFWDLAATQNAGDYTAGVLIAKEKYSKTYYILDCVRGQWSTDKRNRIMMETAARDQVKYGEIGSIKIFFEQEPGSAGKDVAKHITKMMAGFSVKAIKTTGSKELRADPYSAQLEAGNIYIIKNGEWVEAFIDEHCIFPNGKNDDQVDAASGAFNQLAKGASFISIGSGLLG